MKAKSELKADAISRHVHALLQTPVLVQQGGPQDLSGLLVRAEIIDAAGALVCVVLADSAAAGSTGAALSKIPAGAVVDIVRRAKLLDEDTLANYHEVANVLTVLTTSVVGRRTILRSLSQGPRVTPHEEWVARAPHKAWFRIAVHGYPVGTLGFFYL